jgi:thiamine pyrophosphate-dependent acetolactate synthase large subunit-like protein
VGQDPARDWSLVNGNLSGWPQRLWTFDKYHQYIGVSGGSGIGYGSPAAIGAALANKKYGRLSVNIQNDGDLMYAPGVLWTAAHHQIPILTVVHNNRAYHEETMHLQRMGNRRNRGVDRAHIGNEIDNPAIDYAKLAQSLGWYAEGADVEPQRSRPALAARDRGREKGAAGARGRRDAAAMMRPLLPHGSSPA